MPQEGSHAAPPYKTDLTYQPEDIVFAADRRGRVVYWSGEAERVFGHTRGQVLGMPVEPICRARGDSPINLQNILAGHDFAGGLQCRHRDGRELALYMYATPGRDETGSIAGVVFVARDVSDFWRAEEAVRASADKYRLLFENTLDSVAIADLDGQVLEANPAWLRLYGYTAEEIKQMNLADVVAPESRAVAAEAMADLSRGKPVQTTLRMLRKDGSGLVVDLLAHVATVGDGRRIFSVTHDVTERVRAEQATQDSEEKYRTIFESANDAVFLETPAGRIIEVNENACRLLGYERMELLSKSVSDIVPAEARPWLPRVTDTLLATGRFRSEGTNVRRDGTTVPVEISASLISLSDKPFVLAVVRDISERAKAERALRESEEKYRTLAETSPDAVAVIDRGGRITYASPRLASLHGYDDPAEMVGKRVTETVAPADREKAKGIGRLTYEQGCARDLQFTMLRKDGTTFDGELNTSVVHDVSGAPLGIIGVTRDVTERKRAEQALRDSEERFRSMADNIQDGMTIIEQGRTAYVNDRACEIFGYPRDELMRMTMHEIAGTDDRARIHELARAARERGGQAVGEFEYWCTRKDGARRYVHSRYSFVFSPTHVARGYVLTTDITERKRAEQQVAESEDKYRRLVEMSPDVIAVHQDGGIVMINRAGAKLLGYDDPNELLGRSILDFLSQEDRGKVAERIGAIMKQGQPSELLEEHFLRRDGSVVPVEALAAPFSWHGRPAVQVLVRDISDRLRAEQALRESESKFRRLSEDSPNMIFINYRGKVVYANRRCEDVLGYSVGELVDPGFDFMRLIAPDSVGRIRANFARHLRGEEVEPYEYSLVSKPGRPVEAIITTRLVDFGGDKAILGIVTDITERKRAEQALRESEAEYRTSIDAMTDAVHVVDRELRVLLANASFRAWMRRLGLPSELAGRRLRDAFPFLQTEVEAEYRRVFETGQPLATEETTTVGDRSVATETRKVPVIENGETVRVLTIVRDVTERKQVQKRLQESEDQFRRLVELSPDGIVVHQDGRIVLVNQAGASILGYDKPADLIGIPVLALVHPDDRDGVVVRIRRVMEQGRPGDLTEERFRRRDGGYAEVEVVNAPFVWSGRPAVQVVVRDVSERKRLARTLEEASGQIDAILENSPDGIAAECDGVIAYANRKFAKMLGYDSPDQVVGRPSREFDAPDDRERLAEYSRLRVSGKHAPEHYVLRGLRRDGSRIDLDASISTYRNQGRTYVLAFVRELKRKP